MPVYFMSLFYIPRLVRLRLGQIQRDFLWEEGALEQKPYLARWSIICSNNKKGGLGSRISECSTWSYNANEVGILLRRKDLFGGKSLV